MYNPFARVWPFANNGSDPQPINNPGLTSSQENTAAASCAAGSTPDSAAPAEQADARPRPITGLSLQDAISRLQETLQAVDRKKQNEEAVTGLISRLNRLSDDLLNPPTVRDPREESRKASLASVLQETSDKLGNFDKRNRRYPSWVKQAIDECSSGINDYLVKFLLESRMQVQHEVDTMVTKRQSFQLPKDTCVTLVDATGCQRQIPVNFCTSYQQLNMMLTALFQNDSIEAQVQNLFFQGGRYDLCIDRDTKTTELTSDTWQKIEAGTTIVMRAIIPQFGKQKVYWCHFCTTKNVPSNNDWLERLVACQGCGRRFQVSSGRNTGQQEEPTIREEIKRTDITLKKATTGKLHLIRNFRIRPIEQDEFEAELEFFRGEEEEELEEMDEEFLEFLSFFERRSEEERERRLHSQEEKEEFLELEMEIFFSFRRLMV